MLFVHYVLRCNRGFSKFPFLGTSSLAHCPRSARCSYLSAVRRQPSPQHLSDIMRQAQTGAVPCLTVRLGNETPSSRLNARQLPPALAWSFQLTLLRPNFCHSMSLALACPCTVLLASDSGPNLILSPHGLDPCGYPVSSLV